MAKYISHSDSESKSKYVGGFVKGKNTSAYNHDYYIHNKEKWQSDISNTGKMVLGKLWESATKFTQNVIDAISGKNQNQPEKIDTDKSSQVTNLKTKQPNHKYLYRVTYKGKYRYFYTETEYYSFLTNLKKKQSSFSIEEDCKAINEDYPDEGYVMNCASCTVAYDLRRRGYDCKSVKGYGMITSEIPKMWKNGSFSRYKATGKSDSEKFCNRMARYGDGARGIVNVRWADGSGGHVMNFEVVNGQTYVIDCQSGKTYNSTTFSRFIGDKINWDQVDYMRTDNLEMAEDCKYKVSSRG